jgi:hypothetical protein
MGIIVKILPMDTLCKPTTLISDITNSSNAPILHEAKKKRD